MVGRRLSPLMSPFIRAKLASPDILPIFKPECHIQAWITQRATSLGFAWIPNHTGQEGRPCGVNNASRGSCASYKLASSLPREIAGMIIDRRLQYLIYGYCAPNLTYWDVSGGRRLSVYLEAGLANIIIPGWDRDCVLMGTVFVPCF